MEHSHFNHRKRMREKFDSQGHKSFADHEILEMLLFYSVPRVNTNPLAHKLIEKFGSLSNVLKAKKKALLKVEGIGEQTAIYLTLIGSLLTRVRARENNKITVIDSIDATDIILPEFENITDEKIYLLAIDDKFRIRYNGFIIDGNIENVDILPEMIANECIKCRATRCYIAHNHPSGCAIPSKVDVESSAEIERILESAGVSLEDHYVVSDGDYVSFYDSGFLLKQKNRPE